jgi:pyruvate formate lyase activating enzyme
MIHEAALTRKLEEGRVECRLCAHRCRIGPGAFGICGVRENRAGGLVTHVYGEVIAAHVDPIEKKPFYHFLPGTTAFSIATAGCNFRCGFCQNWEISQLSAKDAPGGMGRPFPPAAIVRSALESGCRSVSYTYTEPTIFFEYAAETAALAKAAGLANTFVTNGFMTAEALAAARPWLDAANVDLKAFRDETYKTVCGGRLEPVLETIRRMRESGIWVEVTTLVVPGLNDGDEELRGIAGFLAGVDRDIPWHISRFHPDYEYTQAGPTPLAALRRAAGIGADAGLRYVYIGNVGGEGDETRCPNCRKSVIERRGFRVEENKVSDGRCPFCRTPIAGVFG